MSRLEKIYTNKENPLKDFLDEVEQNDEEMRTVDFNPNKPALPYKKKAIVFPKNFPSETHYNNGVPIGKQLNLGGSVQQVIGGINTILEVLSFLCLRQLPIVASSSHEQLENSKEFKNELQNHLTKITEQLEINRKSIIKDQTVKEDLNKKQYETLYALQEKLLNMLAEKQSSNELKNLERRLDEKIKIIEQQLSEIKLMLS
ncbi:unnamed protein product [Soybean chlorotic mottle virus]|uniref:Uncharacterized protein 2 n=1 Tax=Soybean chlorotic mottle virus TaxID=10651 RepID=Y2_SOCMV|nr:hypothetical protein SbCMVgp2 [Soybean chlorotic mottle virus]P15630.2 RecName: Full=Uncharacterized protein 2 [Soybean chlorotic mottle virus]CAC16942.1 unnamed protein product [Soybean chlorotic mottle virus]